MDEALTIDQCKLRNHDQLCEAESSERRKLIPGGPADRKSNLKIRDEILNQGIRLLRGAAFVERIDCDVECLKPSAAILTLQLGHQARRSLAVGARGEDKLERDNLALILAQLLLTLAGQRECQLRRFANGARVGCKRTNGAGGKREAKKKFSSHV